MKKNRKQKLSRTTFFYPSLLHGAYKTPKQMPLSLTSVKPAVLTVSLFQNNKLLG